MPRVGTIVLPFLDPMLSKSIRSQDLGNAADPVRGLTLGQARDLVRFARRRLREEKLPQVAGSLTFTTTLALVPLLTIVLAILTTFPVFGQLRTALDSWFVQNLMPRAIANTISYNLTQFASKAKGLSALGAVLLLVTTTTMMGMIERAFNQIWGVRRPRPWSQRVLVYWALISLGPILFGLSLTATTRLFSPINMKTVPSTTSLPSSVAAPVRSSWPKITSATVLRYTGVPWCVSTTMRLRSSRSSTWPGARIRYCSPLRSM